MILFERQTLIKIDNPKINTGLRFQSFILSVTKKILLQSLIQNIKIYLKIKKKSFAQPSSCLKLFNQKIMALPTIFQFQIDQDGYNQPNFLQQNYLPNILPAILILPGKQNFFHLKYNSQYWLL